MPYVPHTRCINVINITPSRDNFASDVNTVIDAGDALTTATNGGGGKTFLMVGVAVELRKRGKRVMFAVPMHKHKDTIIAKGKLFNTEFKHKTDVYLYADFMNRRYFDIFKMFMGVDVVIMEEVAQTNTDYIRLIAMLKRHLKFTVLASGDNIQCDPPLEKGQVYVDLFANKYFRELTGYNEVHLQYNPEFGRYPEDLRNVISEFLETHEFPVFPIAQELTRMHLTCTVKRVREICSIGSDHFSKGRIRTQHEEFYYCEGMPLIGVQNNNQLRGGEYDENTKLVPKNYQVYNREEYEILTLDTVNETFYIMNLRTRKIYQNVQLDSVYNMMMPFYAMTYDASQSSQINMPFTMHQLDHPRFSIELANVAMSRSTRLEYIHRADTYQPLCILQHTKIINQVRVFPLSDNTNNKYSDTKIYELWIKGVLAYVGHTYLTVQQRLDKHLQDSKRNPSTPLHKLLATVNHKTDVEIRQVKRFCLQNKAQAEDLEMKYIHEKLSEGHELLNVQQETSEQVKRKEIEVSKNDMRMQAETLKEISKIIKLDELQFNIIDYPDDKYYSVSHTLLNNDPKYNKFRYTGANKDEVKLSIMNHLNQVRKYYKLPPAFISWDTVPVEIVKKRIEEKLTAQNISAQTFISFYVVDYPDQDRIKLGYSINNARRLYKCYKYAKHGIDAKKIEIGEFMKKFVLIMVCLQVLTHGMVLILHSMNNNLINFIFYLLI